ncbi:secreted protein of Ly-6 domain 1-like [Sceloporus undulatus]|uniref:secreted protein of Ly-6 domain 1-like n=1 Tax=Sceloporus undulatus TaxID=8520 RepID=UPI001C4D116E|nr:secreted protein of Ly-6 domain 1-like [Sceloporus undulatus]
MNKILLLSISVMLGSVLAEALVCHFCKIYRKGLGCTIGEATCEAEKGQKCKTVTVFKKNVRHFLRRGCTSLKDKCGTTEENPMFGSMTTTCCDDRDFCNDDTSEALLCYGCKMFKPGDKCLDGEGFCIAKSGQQSAVRDFHRYGCTMPNDKCGSKGVDPSWGTVTTTCCNSGNYCNKP